ncbi:MAG: hypothetical protein K2Y21_04675 [Phycisphaerales bacterium]|nr:hypothetical protein [Phycisphaerales bacterium]
MSPLTISIFVVVMLLIDSVVVVALLSNAAEEFRTLAKQFPPVPPQAGARRREFQSFRFDLLNLGWCLHATLDATYLHLEPAWLLRRLGAGPVSIPRDRITKATRTFTAAKATLGSTIIRGPRWCLLPDAHP